MSTLHGITVIAHCFEEHEEYVLGYFDSAQIAEAAAFAHARARYDAPIYMTDEEIREGQIVSQTYYSEHDYYSYTFKYVYVDC